MDGWTTFFQTTAGAAATLTGMVVVAISINLSRILDVPHLPNRAAGSIAPLAGVLIVSLLALVPGQPTAAWGCELLTAGLIIGALTLLMVIQAHPRSIGRARAWTWLHLVMSLGQSLPLIIGGALALLGQGAGPYWTVPAIVLAMLSGVINTWVLLIEILR
jgi:modulator of FtsH protease